MNVYEHRRDLTYLAVLDERMAIDGPNGLLAKAIKISRPFLDEDKGKTYDRLCRIDFAGIAGTNLFDTGGNIVSTSVAHRLEALLRELDTLNAQGVFVKLRFLLVYPYCTYAISRMQAELSRNRSSMEHPQFERDFSLVESVDKEMFNQTSFVRSQTVMLEQLQEWMEHYGWTPIVGGRSTKGVNRIHIRFAPVSPNQCLLFINDTIFVDAYLLAKKQRETKRCANIAPLIEVNQAESRETFDAFNDHFRYLWDLDMTIYADDATHYEPGKGQSLRMMKTPDIITFERKAAHIRAKVEGVSDELIQKWRFKVARLLNRHCTLPAATPSSESLFITCSWEKGKDKTTIPNTTAQHLSKILETDFGSLREDPLLSVNIMQGAAGEFLTAQLYARLQESTLAIVLMTADIKDKSGTLYSKPNVYHELGYLMKHIGRDRVLLVCEEGTMIPANIQDLIRVTFTRGKLALAYHEIVHWLNRTCSFGADVTIKVLEQHVARLGSDKGLGRWARQAAVKKAAEDIETLRNGAALSSIGG